MGAEASAGQLQAGGSGSVWLPIFSGVWEPLQDSLPFWLFSGIFFGDAKEVLTFQKQSLKWLTERLTVDSVVTGQYPGGMRRPGQAPPAHLSGSTCKGPGRREHLLWQVGCFFLSAYT